MQRLQRTCAIGLLLLAGQAALSLAAERDPRRLPDVDASAVTASAVSSSVLAPEAAHRQVDVVLGADGLFCGVLVDWQGQPLCDAAVGVWHEGTMIAFTQTDTRGHFTFTGIRPGLHAVVAGRSSRLVHAWPSDAAPAAAGTMAAIASDDPRIGGQLLATGMAGLAVRNMRHDPAAGPALAEYPEPEAARVAARPGDDAEPPSR